MKRLSTYRIKIIELLILATLVIVLGNTSNAQSQDSFLKLKVDIMYTYKADIMVFQYIDSLELWDKTTDVSGKRKSKLMLDPTKTYQVWFTSDEGLTKILYIQSGIKGPWFKHLNLDFSVDCALYARMYQDVKSYDYILEPVDRGYDATLSASK